MVPLVVRADLRHGVLLEVIWETVKVIKTLYPCYSAGNQ